MKKIFKSEKVDEADFNKIEFKQTQGGRSIMRRTAFFMVV